MNIASSYIRKYLNFVIKIIQIKKHSSLEKSPHQNSAEDSHVITIKWCILCNAIKVFMLWVIYCFYYASILCILRTAYWIMWQKVCATYIFILSKRVVVYNLTNRHTIGALWFLSGFSISRFDHILYDYVTSTGTNYFRPSVSQVSWRTYVNW